MAQSIHATIVAQQQSQTVEPKAQMEGEHSDGSRHNQTLSCSKTVDQALAGMQKQG